MKKIYFVRHGESEGNVGEIRQTKETPLSPRGRSQAAYIAARAAKLPIDVIVSSTMVRAAETARSISETTGKEVEHSDLFVERRRSSEQLGKRKDDPVALEVDALLIENFAVPGYRYSDEENFDDLKRRAGEALEFLKNRSEQNILVVTHGIILRSLAARAVFGPELSARECELFIRTFHTENTGITVFEYDEERRNPWGIWIWNDHAHLAELEG